MSPIPIFYLLAASYMKQGSSTEGSTLQHLIFLFYLVIYIFTYLVFYLFILYLLLFINILNMWLWRFNMFTAVL